MVFVYDNDHYFFDIYVLGMVPQKGWRSILQSKDTTLSLDKSVIVC